MLKPREARVREPRTGFPAAFAGHRLTVASRTGTSTCSSGEGSCGDRNEGEGAEPHVRLLQEQGERHSTSERPGVPASGTQLGSDL